MPTMSERPLHAVCSITWWDDMIVERMESVVRRVERRSRTATEAPLLQHQYYRGNSRLVSKDAQSPKSLGDRGAARAQQAGSST